MAKSSSRSAKRKETKPYYKYGNVYRNKAQYIKYRNRYYLIAGSLFFIGIVVSAIVLGIALS